MLVRCDQDTKAKTIWLVREHAPAVATQAAGHGCASLARERAS
jgi:hypothetical protein